MEERRRPWSGLAIASLAGGVLSLGLGFVMGIPAIVLGVPAIVCGHLGRARILKSGGYVRGKLMALAGLTVAYFMLFLSMLVPGLSNGHVSMKKANFLKTKTDAIAIASAIEQYYQEYGKVPPVGCNSEEIRTEGTSGVQLLTILLGKEFETDSMQNSRKLPFLCVATAKHRKKGGLIYESGMGSPVVGLFDAWGNPFRVILDDDYDEVLQFTFGGKAEVVQRKRALVASKGPDGIEGTEDDVKSW